jgi:hypothetical protein
MGPTHPAETGRRPGSGRRPRRLRRRRQRFRSEHDPRGAPEANGRTDGADDA